MKVHRSLVLASAAAISAWSTLAHATSSAEFYTTESYQYGRFEASIRFPAGSGVIGAYFLWKDGSEVEGTYWNELDFEKVGADCTLDSNAFYGDPEKVHTQDIPVTADLCADFHTYGYEWTPEYIAWFVDGTEVRKETGETATAYAENATAGMQIRFNIWPGDASFGGVFDPSIPPVYEQVDWVQYSSYANGTFTLEWREDFDAPTPPTGWAKGNWDSPKGLSTHSASNVGVADGILILALTGDEEQGIGATSSGTGGASVGTGGNPAQQTGGAGVGTGGASVGTGGAGVGTGGTPAQQTGGSMATGGGGTAAPTGDEGDESGCACRAATSRPRNALGSVLLLGTLLVGWTRRPKRTKLHGGQS